MELGFLWGWKGLVVLCPAALWIILAIRKWDYIKRKSRLDQAALVAVCLQAVVYGFAFVAPDRPRRYAMLFAALLYLPIAIACFVSARNSPDSEDQEMRIPLE